MSDTALIHLITALRVGVAVSWTMIGLIGCASIYRVIIKRSVRGDIGWASLFLIAVGLLIFQWRNLAGFTPPVVDPFVATALLSFILSAVGIFIARALKAPEGHQRAALISHLMVLIACMFAGTLS